MLNTLYELLEKLEHREGCLIRDLAIDDIIDRIEKVLGAN
jgi:hypothetical protein